MDEFNIRFIASPVENLKLEKEVIIDFINSNQLDEEDLNYAEKLLKKYEKAIKILKENKS